MRRKTEDELYLEKCEKRVISDFIGFVVSLLLFVLFFIGLVVYLLKSYLIR